MLILRKSTVPSPIPNPHTLWMRYSHTKQIQAGLQVAIRKIRCFLNLKKYRDSIPFSGIDSPIFGSYDENGDTVKMITVLSIQKKIRSLNGRMPGRLLYLTSYWIIYCTYYYNLEQIMDL